MTRKIFLGIVALIVLFLGLWYWSYFSQKSVEDAKQVSSDEEVINNDADIILFYGKGCPHCNNVEEFINENNIQEKVNFEYLEVWYNRDNSRLLFQKAGEECGYDTETLGVPFLYARGQCYSGEPDIEKFLSEEAGIFTE